MTAYYEPRDSHGRFAKGGTRLLRSGEVTPHVEPAPRRVPADELAEEMEFFAQLDGILPLDTRLRWPVSFRQRMARRFRMNRTTLERALYRYYRQEQQ